MSEEEIKTLEKDIKKKKRIAGEWAARLHDLVEERLPAAFEEIPGMAEATFNACQEWQEATERLKQASNS